MEFPDVKVKNRHTYTATDYSPSTAFYIFYLETVEENKDDKHREVEGGRGSVLGNTSGKRISRKIPNAHLCKTITQYRILNFEIVLANK